MLFKGETVDNEGATRFLMHALRQAAASLFIEQGWAPKKIQTMLGHSSITMT
ncbi:tyrosine-type recombinase/integrase [Tsuneonella troitsensis]|uniref:tyrosine-type recombinase/integrase n=1 Tax=Tsuneonella troitsensis TaxID=292222 RepID=UPI0009F867A6|nr:tyrosine-type recombinase/integrase [Tsuneonella troitsensis]